ncbi:hypothetical protein ACFVUB_14520 [Streptomyces niveus]|uniref:hypothetical protein n=1 Tax=Streptomyces niveus TaxID=193462 RepID=UPI0036DF9E74
MTETEIRESTATAPWPSPEQAYEHAPDILSEIGWTVRAVTDAIDMPYDSGDVREYWLRKAALLDRIALRAPGGRDSTLDANAAALYLVDTDHARTPATDTDPRGYVRHQYARWSATNS